MQPRGGGIKNRGFTLIELLAVIVILAVIALISVPIVLNIIVRARKSAFKDTAYGMQESAKAEYLRTILDGEDEPRYFEYPFDNLQFSGTKPKGGKISIDKDGLMAIAIYNDEWCAIKQFDEKEVKVIDYKENICKVDSSSMPSIPIEISVPEKTVLKVTEVAGYDLLAGVTATDTNGKNYIPQISGSLSSTVGDYTITYIVTDEWGNKTTKERIITVEKAEGPILNFSNASTGELWTKNQTITVTASHNSNIKSFTYEVIKDEVSQGVKNVSVSGKSVEFEIPLTEDGRYTINLTATDEYDSDSSVSSGTYQIDVTPPTAGTATFTGTLGNNGWYKSNVTVNVVNGSDSLSGHARTTSNINSITSYTAGTKVIITTVDNAGNSSTRDYTIKMDKIAPTITMSNVTIKTSEATNYDLMTGVKVTDDSSNTPTVKTNGTISASAGTYTITYTATDEAGNQATKSRTITVESSGKTGTELVKNNSDVKSLDTGKNPRFVGKNPSNYVNFGNELYRIIGVFNGQIKIIYWGKQSNPGAFYNSTSTAFDPTSSSGGHGTYGYNDWNQAKLQTTFNTTYWNTIPTTYQAMVDQTHVWNIGGTSNWNSSTRSQFYIAERSSTISSVMTSATWKGKVGLMYPSDYGYATSSTNSVCDSVVMYNWGQKDANANKYCAGTEYNWLASTLGDQWTITPKVDGEMGLFCVHSKGAVDHYHPSVAKRTRPVLFLKANVKVVSGKGTQTEPFELSM